MARPIRIEFEGAIYHVMARGNRRENIFWDEEDRRMFLRTLDAACKRTGFRVHAYVLMSNHYHLLLETPEANLSAGMGWLQNAFTRRFNIRHELWGHLFGDRYKAILVEPGNGFWALLDYIHLNPVRAGLVDESQGLEFYRWSSLDDYLAEPERRPTWLETGMGFGVSGCVDNAAGRREFLESLESRVDWRKPGKAGLVVREGEAGPTLAPHCSLRRGWFFGSQQFKEQLLKLGRKYFADRSSRSEDGYSGDELRDHGESEAQFLLEAGLEHFELDFENLPGLAKGDWRKGLIAALIHERTSVRLGWIAERLQMGTVSFCCRTISLVRAQSQYRDQREALKAAVKTRTRNRD